MRAALLAIALLASAASARGQGRVEEPSIPERSSRIVALPIGRLDDPGPRKLRVRTKRPARTIDAREIPRAKPRKETPTP